MWLVIEVARRLLKCIDLHQAEFSQIQLNAAELIGRHFKVQMHDNQNGLQKQHYNFLRQKSVKAIIQGRVIYLTSILSIKYL